MCIVRASLTSHDNTANSRKVVLENVTVNLKLAACKALWEHHLISLEIMYWGSFLRDMVNISLLDPSVDKYLHYSTTKLETCASIALCALRV